jgi:hypothetical protein
MPRAFVKAWDRAPDEGWNHRLMGTVDPYGEFLPELVKFMKQASHKVSTSILPAPPGSSHYESRRTLLASGRRDANDIAGRR